MYVRIPGQNLVMIRKRKQRIGKSRISGWGWQRKKGKWFKTWALPPPPRAGLPSHGTAGGSWCVDKQLVVASQQLNSAWLWAGVHVCVAGCCYSLPQLFATFEEKKKKFKERSQCYKKASIQIDVCASRSTIWPVVLSVLTVQQPLPFFYQCFIFHTEKNKASSIGGIALGLPI